jgi:regulator of replication initiation timing
MSSKKPMVRLEEELEKKLEAVMKRYKLKSRTKALHQGWRDLELEIEELLKENKRLREEARHHRKKAEKRAAKDHQKADSTSKPQQEQQWKVTDEWINELPWRIKHWRGLPYPFPCPIETGKFCWQLQRRQCKKNTPNKFKLCQDWKRFIFDQINKRLENRR